METSKLQHLYQRAAFGISFNNLTEKRKWTASDIIADLFLNQTDFIPIRINYEGLDKEYQSALKNKKTSKDTRKVFQQKSKKLLKKLNLEWLNHMQKDNIALRERMTLFWSNHFVCESKNIFNYIHYTNTIREHALGNLGDFILAISKESAMLSYLNNKQNKKQQPNENFARELLELFTLGEGNYTEKDIQEAARAFTGWKSKKDGTFYVNNKQHDFGLKTFMGETGNWNGEDIIAIILKQEQCAIHICTMIYRYFVHPEIDYKIIENLARSFRKEYDINKLMETIFSSEWFYNSKNIGAKIKSPIDLLTSLNTIIPFKFKKHKELLFIEKFLGQVLTKPPNVAGWAGNQQWIDSNTLMIRLKLASYLFANGEIELGEKGSLKDSLETLSAKKKRPKRKLEVEMDWKSTTKLYEDIDWESLKKFILYAPLSKETEKIIAFESTLPKKQLLLYCLSLPEFQLC